MLEYTNIAATEHSRRSRRGLSVVISKSYSDYSKNLFRIFVGFINPKNSNYFSDFENMQKEYFSVGFEHLSFKENRVFRNFTIRNIIADDFSTNIINFEYALGINAIVISISDRNFHLISSLK